MSHSVTTQTAVVAKAAGKVELVTNAAIPKLEENEVLVKVRAIALNPADWKTVAYSCVPNAVSGCDFAGTVVGPPGPKTRRPLAEGTRVCGWIMGGNPARPSNGSFAEYIAAKADLLFRIPDSISFETAATLGVAASTGGLALFKNMGLSFAERKVTLSSPFVLVYGAATSSGTIAIQLLRIAGYRAIAICSPCNFDLVVSLGAVAAFDYHSSTCGKDVRAYSYDQLGYALDCISTTSSMTICYEALGSKGGKYVSLDPFPERVQQTRPEIRAEWILTFTMLGDVVGLVGIFRREAAPDDYEFGIEWHATVDRLLAEGKLQPHPVDVTRSAEGLAGVEQGLELLKKGHVQASKLVYRVGA